MSIIITYYYKPYYCIIIMSIGMTTRHQEYSCVMCNEAESISMKMCRQYSACVLPAPTMMTFSTYYSWRQRHIICLYCMALMASSCCICHMYLCQAAAAAMYVCIAPAYIWPAGQYAIYILYEAVQVLQGAVFSW